MNKNRLYQNESAKLVSLHKRNLPYYCITSLLHYLEYKLKNNDVIKKQITFLMSQTLDYSLVVT